MKSIYMRFPDGKGKAVTLSYDDGSFHDMKLIAIMKQYGLKGTFNICSGWYNAPSKLTPIDFYGKNGMEVAVHTRDHPDMRGWPSHLCLQQIMEDRLNLERECGTIVQGMAYPYGAYNDTIKACARLCGIVYSRSVASSNGFALPEDWLEWAPTCHHNNPRLMELTERFLSMQVKKQPQVLYVWGHSYEFDTHENWEVIEKFAQLAGNREDVWYATNLQIWEYVRAYESLVFSADGTRAMNPSSVDVFLLYGGQNVTVPAGQCVSLEL